MGGHGAAPGVPGGERGAVLVIGLVGTFVATLLAIALFDLGVVQSRLQRDNVCTRRAVHAAEAGLLRAWQDIERAPGSPSYGPLNFNKLYPPGGGGTLGPTLTALPGNYTDVQLREGLPDTYSVQARTVPGPGKRIIRLVSRGRVPSGCRQEGADVIQTVQADLTRQSTPLGAPFVGSDRIKMNKDKATTDSYNSFVGKYSVSSCPKYDAKGKPIKVLGCGGSLWSDGNLVTGAAKNCDDKNDSTSAPICLKGGATVFGDVTASKGWIWVEGKKDKKIGAIWGDATYESNAGSDQWGNMFCKDQACTKIVQGTIIKGTVPSIPLNPVLTWGNNDFDLDGTAPCVAKNECRCGGSPSAATKTGPGTYSTQTWLSGRITVYDDKNNAVTCMSAKDKGHSKFCTYEEADGTLVIDEKDTRQVVVQQGQYCLQSVVIKNTTGIALEYDANPTKVLPVQWNLKGTLQLDDKVKKGKAASGVENDPWLFMILSECDRNATGGGCPEMKLALGLKQPGDDQGLYAYVYAPKAKLKFSGDGDLFGAAVGGYLQLDKAQLHFDEGLLNLVEICPTCSIPPYLTSKPSDKLGRWRRCVAPPGGECP
jgi:hypothetical protein